jgi:hypothetical protein
MSLYEKIAEETRTRAASFARRNQMQGSDEVDLAQQATEQVLRRVGEDEDLRTKLGNDAVRSAYIRTTVARIGFAVLRQSRRKPTSRDDLLQELIEDRAGFPSKDDVSYATKIVQRVRANLRKGGLAERVLDAFVKGAPLPKLRRVPRDFREGIGYLELEVNRCLQKELGPRAFAEFLSALRMLRTEVLGTRVESDDFLDPILERAQWFESTFGTEAYLRRLNYLDAESYDTFSALSGGKPRLKIIEDLASKMRAARSVSDGGSTGVQWAAYQAFIRHEANIMRVLQHP